MVRNKNKPTPQGFTYLEVQVALALFMIAISGLGPLAVIQSRQLAKLEERFDPGEIHHLVPSSNEWARKLGAVATVSTSPGSPPAPPITLIDNFMPGYSEVIEDNHDWYTWTTSGAMNGLQREIEEDDMDNIARWTFSNLTPGSYEVLVTYAKHHDLADDAPYRIYDNGVRLRTVRVNQETDPAGGNAFAGRQWDSLGHVTITGAALVVELEPDAEDWVGADGVRIRARRNTVELTSLTKTAATETVSAVVSVNVVVN